MINEKSLRSDTAADEQFTTFISPEEAVITVTIASDVRQVGKNKLASKLAGFLKAEGYINVKIQDNSFPFDLEDNVQKLHKRVNIVFDVK
jgi:hypothetical protein